MAARLHKTLEESSWWKVAVLPVIGFPCIPLCGLLMAGFNRPIVKPLVPARPLQLYRHQAKQYASAGRLLLRSRR